MEGSGVYSLPKKQAVLYSLHRSGVPIMSPAYDPAYRPIFYIPNRRIQEEVVAAMGYEGYLKELLFIYNGIEYIKKILGHLILKIKQALDSMFAGFGQKLFPQDQRDRIKL